MCVRAPTWVQLVDQVLAHIVHVAAVDVPELTIGSLLEGCQLPLAGASRRPAAHCESAAAAGAPIPPLHLFARRTTAAPALAHQQSVSVTCLATSAAV